MIVFVFTNVLVCVLASVYLCVLCVVGISTAMCIHANIYSTTPMHNIYAHVTLQTHINALNTYGHVYGSVRCWIHENFSVYTLRGRLQQQSSHTYEHVREYKYTAACLNILTPPCSPGKHVHSLIGQTYSQSQTQKKCKHIHQPPYIHIH